MNVERAEMTDAERDCAWMLDHNPLERLFPMTHKNHHGVELSVWASVLSARGISARLEKYDHLVYATKEEPSHTFEADRIVLEPERARP